MSGHRFIVSLEGNKSEKTLKVSSLLKESVVFWDEDIHINDNTVELVREADKE